MRKILATTAVAAVLLVGCSQPEDASKVDLKEPKRSGSLVPENYEVRVPDLLLVTLNIDNHPTVAKICIDGVAFATTSRDFNALTRIPEWDEDCKAVEK